jgi:hypothetical protein
VPENADIKSNPLAFQSFAILKAGLAFNSVLPSSQDIFRAASEQLAPMNSWPQARVAIERHKREGLDCRW